MMKLKILVIIFAVIIIVLFGILFLYNPVKRTTNPPAAPISTSTMTSVN